MEAERMSLTDFTDSHRCQVAMLSLGVEILNCSWLQNPS